MCVPSQPFARSKLCVMMNSSPQAELPNQQGETPWNDLNRCTEWLCSCRSDRSEDRLGSGDHAACPCKRLQEDIYKWRMIGLQLRTLADDFQWSRRRKSRSSAVCTKSLAAVSGALSVLISSCIHFF